MLASTLSHTLHSGVREDTAAGFIFFPLYIICHSTLWLKKREKTIRGITQSLVGVHHIQSQHAAHLCNNWHQDEKKCLIELWFTPCRCSWVWFNAYSPACGSCAVLSENIDLDTSCSVRLQRRSNGTNTRTFGHTSAQRVWQKLSLVHSFCFAILLPLSFLESSQHPSFHTYAHGGCGVRLRHVGCVLIRGGHSVTGAGERGDEGVISSLGDR